MLHQMTHPDAEQLSRYLIGRLSGDESRFVGDHLDGCAECCHQIESMGIGSLLSDVGDSSAPGAMVPGTAFMVPADGLPLNRVPGSTPPPSLEVPSPAGASARYEIVEQFAEGGMSALYRARDCHLDRDVALKILSTGRNQETRIRRFRAEAVVLGRLQHPGIPPVFDQGRLADGRAFIAMKLIEGQTLAELLECRPSPHSDLMHFLGIFRQICETVAFAHAQGVIHRDLKPENIMVGAFGEVQVMDWGLAKQLAGGPGPAAGSDPNGCPTGMPSAEDGGPGKTMLGAVIGTPAYMPPEQTGVRRQQIDERADIFCLGAILCEILTGHPPYSAESSSKSFEQARAAALGGARERLAASRADRRLVELALRCLAPAPDDRPQSALEIANELEAGFELIQERLRDVELAHARQEEQRQRRRVQMVFFVAMCLIAMTVTGGGAYLARQNAARQRRTVEEVSTALGEANQLRAQALSRPLDGERDWSAAREAIHRARTAGSGITDRVLPARVDELASRIARESEAAQRDRDLLSQLAAADAPDFIPELPMRRLDSVSTQPGAGGGDRSSDSPPGRGTGRDGGSLTRRPPPRGSGSGRGRGPGPGSRGPAPEHVAETQRIHADSVTDRCAAAFAAYGVDPDLVAAERAAEQLLTRPEPVRTEIIASLDSWMSVLCGPDVQQAEHREWVLTVLAHVDPDPDRTRIRERVVARDKEELETVSRDEALLTQSPAFVGLVASQLERAADTTQLLREARARYPDSLLINQQLGEHLVRTGEGRIAVDAYLTALAISPDAPTNVRTAFLLADHSRYDESIVMFRNAIRIDPGCADAYVYLAKVLTKLDRGTEALSVVDDALSQFTPDHASVWRLHVARGEAWEELQQPGSALAAYEAALGHVSLPASEEAGVRERVLRLGTDAPEPL